MAWGLIYYRESIERAHHIEGRLTLLGNNYDAYVEEDEVTGRKLALGGWKMVVEHTLDEYPTLDAYRHEEPNAHRIHLNKELKSAKRGVLIDDVLRFDDNGDDDADRTNMDVKGV
ncbi:hypothetical protein ACFE04_022950 [Oxalis oulophora]